MTNAIKKVLLVILLMAVLTTVDSNAYALGISSSTSATVTNSNVISWSHNISSGAGLINRKLIVGVGIEEDIGTNDDVITSVTINGISLTRITQVVVSSGTRTQRVEAWYLDDASLPNGNRTIQVTTAGNVVEINAGAVLFLNAAQAMPPSQTNSNIGPNTVTTTITTTANGSWVMDIVGSGNANSFTPGPGQSEQWDTNQNFGNNTSASASSTKQVPVAGLASMTQNQNANRLGHIVLEIRPDTFLPPPPPPPVGGGCVTFRDEFSVESYNQNNGTAIWATDWIENDNNNPSNGDVEINAGELQLEGDGINASIEREVNLLNYDTAILTFDYRTSGTWEGSDIVRLQVSSNGGASWTTLNTFRNDQPAQSYSADISGFISANTRVRFIEGANRNNEIFHIDNLQIEACALVHHIEIEHDGSAINCAAENITVRACADASCTSLYTGTVVVDLLPAGWVGGDQVTITGGSSTFDLQILTPGVVTLQANNPSPAASNPYSCVNTSIPDTSCNIEFFPSALVFDVPTQTSCATSTVINVQALGTDPANPAQCVPLFTGNKTLKAWSSYVNPLTGDQVGTPQLTLNGITTATLPVSQPVADNITLGFDATGTATFTVNYPDAGQLGLNLRFDGAGAENGLVLLGSDNFVIRPDHLTVYSDDANADCASNDGSCSLFRRAGNTADPLNEFNLKIDAACADGTVTPNFRMDNIAITSNLVAPLAGINATPGVTSFNMIKSDNGQHVISNQTLSEVGVFTFTATPTASGYFGETIPAATSASIGRFTPAYFETSATNSCGSFTYSGQPILNVDITPFNSNSVNTLNYRDSFVKDPVVSDAGVTTNFTNNTFNLAHFSGSPLIGQRTDVTYTYPLKDSAESTLNLRAIDADNVSSATHTEAPLLIRSGRAVLDNAYGPEQLPLSIPLRIEYYSAAGAGGFVINNDDSCSVYNATLGSNSFANYTDNLGAGETLASGAGTVATGLHDINNPIVLSAPNTGNHGSVNFILNSIDDWLKYNWNYDCDNADADLDITTGADTGLCGPYGKASFGLYRGDDRIIFQREVLP